ncbi:Zeaxanthin epoxidase, chloroplastic [Purpureocillium lavendulum]|uniref:Zeaxanthin epoxidase, chloroplastic n=1 Tax=Purpureocillium lavendulum TaxID=1247861 RepID=A0AB34FRS5_9HYPO|nr:Zeaxanthin epoxidase, chloroplastic [Purpureocillium lavendulum]
MIATLAPPLATAVPYHLVKFANLTLGHTVQPSWSYPIDIHPMDSAVSSDLQRNGISSSLANATQLPPGIYSVRQLVASASPLLDAIVARLGQDPPAQPPARSVLVNGLAASLATSGRESTLPLSHSPQDAARREIVFQSNRIAKTIINHVHENAGAYTGSHDIRFRSPCEGHLWTPSVASLLLGPRSDSTLMELYNEWLHRMILLRDSLLPFENYEEVPLIIPDDSSRGIRDLEEPRKFFLVRCLTGAVQHIAIVDLAKVFTARNLPRGGYGFQYSQGVILPAFLSGSRSLHLLRYHPARFYKSEPDVLFDYEHQEYVNAPRSELTLSKESSGAETVISNGRWNLSSLLAVDTRVTESSLDIDAGNDALRRVVKLRLTLDSGKCVAVDLGQITRGRRYAYDVRSEKRLNGSSPTTNGDTDKQALELSDALSPSTVNGNDIVTLLHNTADILTSPGLVISPRTRTGRRNLVHIIPVTDPVIKLALLGKLYPENVILLGEKDDINALGKTGKGFSERFVIVEQNPVAA